jgi:hypothetical protein
MFKVLGFLLTLLAGPALAAHTQDAVIYDPNTKVVIAVVVPDDDKQLNDPAFNPPGMVQVRVTHIPSTDPVTTATAQVPALQLPPPVQNAAPCVVGCNPAHGVQAAP